MAPHPIQHALDELICSLDPPEIADVTRSWRAQALTVDAISFDALAALTGSFSRTITELRAGAEPAKAATASISERLMAMSIALGKFRADSTAADAASAHAFDLMSDR